MRVSAALIVKDGERTLASCLTSLRDAVDEIVVVDTGSTDSTKSIAERFGARLFDFPWQHDFAAARQFSFDRTTGDWVLWVDADDVVLNADRIRPMIAGAASEVGMFYWRYVYQRDRWGNSLSEFWRERCVRNDGSFRWVGRVHEVLVAERSWETRYAREVVVEHHKEEDRDPGESRRNRDILEAQFAAGDRHDPRLLYYLGRERMDTGDIRGALQVFRHYLRVSEWDDERYLAQTDVAALYRMQGLYKAAIKADLRALIICPQWPDAYFGLAQSYYYLQDWERVIHWTDIGRRLPVPDRLPILNPMKYRYDWIIYYTNALYHAGEITAAEDWTRTALQICPDDEWHRQNMAFFLAQHEPRVWEHDEICYYASHGGPHLFSWSGASLDEGVGGSETAVIELGREWTRQGYRVTVFGDPRERAGVIDGVTYRPWYDMQWHDDFNILILWRYPHLLDRHITARKLFVDMHDITSDDEWGDERLAKVDTVFFKSRTHRAMAPRIPDEQVAIIENGR